MAGGWWGENRDGRTREGRAGKNEERGGEGRWKGRKGGGRAGKDEERNKGRAGKDEERIRERGSRFLWDNSKRIVYKFFMGC